MHKYKLVKGKSYKDQALRCPAFTSEASIFQNSTALASVQFQFLQLLFVTHTSFINQILTKTKCEHKHAQSGPQKQHSCFSTWDFTIFSFPILFMSQQALQEHIVADAKRKSVTGSDIGSNKITSINFTFCIQQVYQLSVWGFTIPQQCSVLFCINSASVENLLYLQDQSSYTIHMCIHKYTTKKTDKVIISSQIYTFSIRNLGF